MKKRSFSSVRNVRKSSFQRQDLSGIQLQFMKETIHTNVFIARRISPSKNPYKNISAHDGGPYECSECSDTFDNKALCVLDTTIWKSKEGLIKATRVALNTLGFLKREIETYNDT